MHTNKNVSIGVNLQIKENSLGLFLNYYKDEIIWFPEMSKPTPTNNMYKEIVFFLIPFSQVRVIERHNYYKRMAKGLHGV